MVLLIQLILVFLTFGILSILLHYDEDYIVVDERFISFPILSEVGVGSLFLSGFLSLFTLLM